MQEKFVVLHLKSDEKHDRFGCAMMIRVTKAKSPHFNETTVKLFSLIKAFIGYSLVAQYLVYHRLESPSTNSKQ